MTFLTPYQLDCLASAVGDIALIVLLVGYVGWFIYRGLSKR
jgi:hypothetical protein